MRSTMRPIVERHKVKLRWGHKAPNSVHKDSQRRNPFSLCKILEPSYEIGCCGFVLHLARRRSTA
ncbi:hypothetical protein M405DRAFT_816730 [Rhizopogon salebrosus TDB-379]|nr:hypothetical protein M405DRAFT_816730 [Rhizopogon salebrosus TDB-379]